LDEQWLILREYANQLSTSGQPGPGDAFFRWVLTNRANPNRCRLVRVTAHSDREFEEFPSDERLAQFDRADRKFVAVAVSAAAPIWIAVDRGWWIARHELTRAGVSLVFLCEAEIAEAAGRKDPS
jgi:hypothetical protein